MMPQALEAALYDWECNLTLQRQMRDAPFFDAVLRDLLQGRGTLAILGCGTGRVAIPLARAGWWVTGIDLSAERLARARALTRGAAWPIWRQGDMRCDPGVPPQDAVIIPYSAFLLLRTDADRQACLKSIREILKPSGYAILDVSPNFLGRPQQRRVPTLSAVAPELNAWVDYYETVRQYPEAEVTLIGKHYLLQCGEVQTRFFYSERWRSLPPEHLLPLASLVSMKIVRSFSDYHGTPLYCKGRLLAGAAKHIHVMTAAPCS